MSEQRPRREAIDAYVRRIGASPQLPRSNRVAMIDELCPSPTPEPNRGLIALMKGILSSIARDSSVEPQVRIIACREAVALEERHPTPAEEAATAGPDA